VGGGEDAAPASQRSVKFPEDEVVVREVRTLTLAMACAVLAANIDGERAHVEREEHALCLERRVEKWCFV
jgi:hypothetical protein